MSMATLLLIKIALGLAAMALACAICVTAKKAVTAGKKVAAFVTGYCRTRFYQA
ncbi:MAG: hypothetical protein P4N41_18935 [Negativicutes bacterium]|nr:hypothetical protein [Negativicutes bacterium]